MHILLYYIFLMTISASESEDYVFVETEFIFEAGTKVGDTQCLGISIIGNNDAEPSESFSLNLASMNPLVRVVQERKKQTLTIIDNDRKWRMILLINVIYSNHLLSLLGVGVKGGCEALTMLSPH